MFVFLLFDFFSSFKKSVQLYCAGRVQSFGTYESRKKAVLAHNIVREKLRPESVLQPFDAEAKKQTERMIELVREQLKSCEKLGSSHPAVIEADQSALPMPRTDLPPHFPGHNPPPTNRLASSQPQLYCAEKF
jgi:hypothetical protein